MYIKKARSLSQKSQPSRNKPTKTNYTPLGRLILDGRFKAGTLKVSNKTLNNVLLKVKSKNGVIRLDPFSLDAYPGNIAGSGKFRFNDGAIVGINLAGMVRHAKAAFGLEAPFGKRPTW